MDTTKKLLEEQTTDNSLRMCQTQPKLRAGLSKKKSTHLMHKWCGVTDHNRWKKTVEIHLKARKRSKNVKKSVLEVDFPILG